MERGSLRYGIAVRDRGSLFLKIRTDEYASKPYQIVLDTTKDLENTSVVKSEKSERVSEGARRFALKRFDSKEARRFSRAIESVEKRPKNPGVLDGHAVQKIIPNNAAFQTEDLDTYDSDCDDISNAQVVLMANISNYGSDVILKVSHSETNLNDMENQSVLAIQDFKQSPVVDFIDNEIHSDNNIIPYSQYFQETQQANVQDTNL
ncbi:hypothetical protein Tco_0281517 [Tanacetum coccineum]